MKRLIIICEGPTESEFCREVLAPALFRHDIIVEAPLIKKSNGGIVPWSSIKRQIEMHLREGGRPFVSMLIDYYGIKDSYNFPGWQESKQISNKTERLNFLTAGMREEINPDLVSRFIPYIQIHEFESLLFSDLEVFKRSFAENEMNLTILENALAEFPNPEDINSRPTLAPSKRLIEAIPGYDKVVYGSCLAEDIGLDRITEKCPLFREWLSTLSAI